MDLTAEETLARTLLLTRQYRLPEVDDDDVLRGLATTVVAVVADELNVRDSAAQAAVTTLVGLVGAQMPGGPVMALFDRDANGKAARETLVKRLGIAKSQVITYGDFLDGNPDEVEAEDLLPGELLQKFVDHYGESTVLAEKQMHPQLGIWHYGFNAAGKDLIGTFLRERATASDMARFVKVAELVRTRMDLPVNLAARTPVSVAETQAAAPAGDQAASDTAAPHPTGEPWKVDGRSWHLQQRCSMRTKPIVEAATDIVTNAVPEASGPDWGHKRYIAWRAGNRMWTIIAPHRTTVWLAFDGVQLSVDEIGDALGFERDEGTWRSREGSFVKTNWRGQPGIHLESVTDVSGESADRLATLMRRAWDRRSRTPDVAPSAGFDWRRIDAAIKALPKDRWTSYGELAELGETAPVPVGQHIANMPIPNAYRVLDSNGRLRPGFHWADASDTRDVRQVLQEDGIRFDESGAADPAQRMTADDLAALIGDEGFEITARSDELRIDRFTWDADDIVIVKQGTPIPMEHHPVSTGGKPALYFAFWSHLLERIHREHPGWTRARKPQTTNWLWVSHPIRGIPLSISFGWKNSLTVELYIDTQDGEYNSRLFDRLALHRTAIESDFGRQLTWDKAEGRRFCSVADVSDGDVARTEKHDEYIEWIFDSMTRGRSALVNLSSDVLALEATAPPGAVAEDHAQGDASD